MLINRTQVEGVRGVRSVVVFYFIFYFYHFSNHFKKVDTYRLGLGELMFKSIDDVEGADLIKPFLMEEIKEAVYECDRFKSP